MKKSMDKRVFILLVVLACVTFVMIFAVTFSFVINKSSQKDNTNTTSPTQATSDDSILINGDDTQSVAETTDFSEPLTTKSEQHNPTVVVPHITQNQHTTEKTLTGWRKAYRDYLLNYCYTSDYDPDSKYALVYVDNNDVPELLIEGAYTAMGNILVACSGSTAHSVNIPYGTMTYFPKGNILGNYGGRQGSFFDQYYSVQNGRFVLVETGKYNAKSASPETQMDINDENYNFYWGDTIVTQADYEQLKEEKIPSRNCYSFGSMGTMTYNEILRELES